MYVPCQLLASALGLCAAIYFLWPLSGRDLWALFFAWFSAGWFANAAWRGANPKILKAQEEGRQLAQENTRRLEEIAEQMKRLGFRS